MKGILAYGSLMHPVELARHFSGEPRLIPVRVRGYRRSFCQEPSWREGPDERRGVLTVRPSEDHWFNGILVCGCGPEALRSLDHRERGYERVPVDDSTIEPYAGEIDLASARPIGVYRGRDEKWNAALLPNAAYVELCTGAARRWGDAFLRDFMATTYVGDLTLTARADAAALR